MSADWDTFIAALNVDELEQERARIHGPLHHERPGSPQDRDMRYAHDWLKYQRRLTAATAADIREQRAVRLQEADADRFIAARKNAAAMHTYERRNQAALHDYQRRTAA
ncbi:hypothetical protein [Curtobacterium sp. MCBD17_030]|uniref:hypothetical protein n=1 Tax=Curtobacterium sp. MCBD17_030 TaxID=2175649 RepID=UPI000DA05F39|nr:hypothetical protein [Curtobacterium sp. MCBD17_030]PYY32371.1 hypothetical protein DEI89_13140 [Curtobacterium sp. MCBD17_030]